MSGNGNKHAFPETEKNELYRAIFERRDIKDEFLPHKISKEILMKILNAAHHAGSVGFMQPRNFIIIEDEQVKRNIKGIFNQENAKACEKHEVGKCWVVIPLKK